MKIGRFTMHYLLPLYLVLHQSSQCRRTSFYLTYTITNIVAIVFYIVTLNTCSYRLMCMRTYVLETPTNISS